MRTFTIIFTTFTICLFGGYALKCNECLMLFNPNCLPESQKECEKDRSDYCVTLYYPEDQAVYKECMSKDELEACRNVTDKRFCITCDTDLCNNLKPEDFTKLTKGVEKKVREENNKNTEL